MKILTVYALTKGILVNKKAYGAAHVLQHEFFLCISENTTDERCKYKQVILAICNIPKYY